MASCLVSFVDSSGIRHSVENEAGSLFEAVALAVKTFREHDCLPGEMTRLEVEIRSSVTHEVTLKKVRKWAISASRAPKEVVLKERLRELL